MKHAEHSPSVTTRRPYATCTQARLLRTGTAPHTAVLGRGGAKRFMVTTQSKRGRQVSNQRQALVCTARRGCMNRGRSQEPSFGRSTGRSKEKTHCSLDMDMERVAIAPSSGTASDVRSGTRVHHRAWRQTALAPAREAVLGRRFGTRVRHRTWKKRQEETIASGHQSSPPSWFT